MRPSVMQNERLVELLVQRAIDGLEPHESAELKQLLAQEDYVDAGRFEQTAAELLLGGVTMDETLPDDLTDRLLDRAASFNPASIRQPTVISPVPRPRKAPARSRSTRPTQSPGRSSSWTNRVAGFAIAASVLIAVAALWPRLQSDGETQVPQTATALDPAQVLKRERAAMLAQQGIVQRSWQPTEDPAASGVRGDVVWDPKTQKGYVRFQGLQANDTTQLQYQLWIFDATRGDQYPIDGGVFDVPATPNASGEVIVPINAKLPVRQAAMFAVTIEKPGGVVVSSRERIVVVAPVAQG